MDRAWVLGIVGAALLGLPQGGAAQHTGHHRHDGEARDTTARVQEAVLHEQPESDQGAGHEMWMRGLGAGWTLMGMAQGYPVVTANRPFASATPLRQSELYLTQPAVMFNVESPGSRVVLRTTLNFEAWTQRRGELTFGGWGEGYIDSRHPHTLLHEAMLSYNVWDTGAGSFSLSAGKGFAPYGTDDPMARPVAKYPTNHHLSQILERWTLNGVWLLPSGLSLEAGLFGGEEPRDPYDFRNIESFGDSWSVRATQRFGGGAGPFSAWEVSASYGRVAETHGDHDRQVTHLVNAAVRHHARYRWGGLYALAEASRSEIRGPEQGYYAILGETRLDLGAGERHRPYYRIEYATRPEYHREGVAGEAGFFRYDHDHGHIDGATRWLINSIGYGYDLSSQPLSIRPFVEVQHSRVWRERGAVDPRQLFGTDRLWSLTAGFRVFVGGDPMRMGSYGVLDPMSAGMRVHHPAAADSHRHH
jgi:hypothetical protein